MALILLTGAGFSRNWGGWLAEEAFEYLLGCPELTPLHRELLWHYREKGGFEAVLEGLRTRTRYIANQNPTTGRELQSFDLMLIGMFNTMNAHFTEFEPGRHQGLGPQPSPVRDFLCRFDAIFTLNQDTFLERKYFTSDIRQGSNGRFFRAYCPGLLEENVAETPYDTPGVFRPADPPYSLTDRAQPYFKLHGSSNWRALNGFSLVVMANDKNKQIDGIALLDWYRGKFREMIGAPDSKLLIIGYSFRDPHINEMIYQGTRTGLKIFIIDPIGLRALEDADSVHPVVRSLAIDLQDHILGASRRPFPGSIFSDQIERAKIQRFLPLFP